MSSRRVLLAGLGLALLIAPGSASAARPAPHREIQAPSAAGAVYLGKASGYYVEVSNPDPHVAILYLDRIDEGGNDEAISDTSYAVRPKRSLSSGSLEASFGAIGSVDLRFRPGRRSPKVGHRSKHCRGRRPQTEFGEYRGSISLRGEGGYFQVRAHRAEGVRDRTYRLSCAGGTAHRDVSKKLWEYVEPNESFSITSSGGSIAELLAVSRRGGRFVYLRAAHMESTGPGAELQAGALELERGMAVGHDAQTSGGEGTLLTSLPGVHPATATLTPPSPFHGEGRYVENSSSSHGWTGTLGVEFPGLDLSLTGPTYATSLCVISPFKTRRPCDLQKIPRVPE